MQILPDKGNSICCIVNNTVCLTKSEQNYYWISTRAHFSYKRIRRISCSSRLHKQSLNLCGTQSFFSTSLSLCVRVRARFFLLKTHTHQSPSLSFSLSLSLPLSLSHTCVCAFFLHTLALSVHSQVSFRLSLSLSRTHACVCSFLRPSRSLCTVK